MFARPPRDAQREWPPRPAAASRTRSSRTAHQGCTHRSRRTRTSSRTRGTRAPARSRSWRREPVRPVDHEGRDDHRRYYEHRPDRAAEPSAISTPPTSSLARRPREQCPGRIRAIRRTRRSRPARSAEPAEEFLCAVGGEASPTNRTSSSPSEISMSILSLLPY